jgi:hypothetical protein
MSAEEVQIMVLVTGWTAGIALGISDSLIDRVVMTVAGQKIHQIFVTA